MSHINKAPVRNLHKMTWEDINRAIDGQFNRIDNANAFALLPIDGFEPPLEEVISEIEKAGYVVSETGDNRLRVSWKPEE